MKSAKSDTVVSQNLSGVILEYNQNKPVLSTCEGSDNFFSKLSLKDLQAQSGKIREQATSYFNNGNFTQFNIVFTKFIKNLTELSNAEMNDFIIKYVISSTLKKNFENAITDINTLKPKYPQYDLNIYI